MSLFQRFFSTLLYVAGTTSSDLIRKVSLIQRSLIERSGINNIIGAPWDSPPLEIILIHIVECDKIGMQ